jgi:hypothetical protein
LEVDYGTAFGIKRKHEVLYVEWSKLSCPPTDIGREQFKQWESNGTIPEEPDEFFLVLQNGKKWFDWQLNDCKKQWDDHVQYQIDYVEWLRSDRSKPFDKIDFWWGWESWRRDWEGEFWKMKELFRWMDEDLMPDWLRDAKPPDDL